ncbi:sensor histidine kinase [Acidimangrovimonas sediminis]|uniref:sensor histidine kinase n=1 Tax=Acidimangrovimonas sediminis TaxID=2056283 RepID=UPI001E5F404A|nr:ATP-binding protein [Acidimangrovimonas sediminis]
MALWLAATLVLALGVGWVSLGDGLARLNERGRADLALAADRLTSQLARYRELSVLLENHPVLRPLLAGKATPQEKAAADLLLRRTADRSGADDFLLVGRQGQILASAAGSNPAAAPAAAPDPARAADPDTDARNAPPATFAGSALLARALHGTTAFTHGLADAAEGRPARRVFTYAVPVFSGNGPVVGAVVVRIDADRVEANWRGAAQAIYFTDALGIVFVANRDELLYARAGTPGPDRAARGLRYGDARQVAFPSVTPLRLAGQALWWIAGGPYLPRLALPLSMPLPMVELRGHILIDAWPALRLALFQAATTAALCLILGGLLLVARERRHSLSRDKALLEARVAERTAELSTAVARLQTEVEERMEAEAALKKAQQDLVQAGKLSALGQMSAGLSHELNQPLMAIRSFAENASAFIGRGRPEAAAENLHRISDLARRMGRIIRNLRAFARSEVEGVADVDLTAVVAAILELTEARIAEAGVTLDHAPPGPVMVRGGEVRLQQVVLNLVSNALDAMEGMEAPRLTLRILPAGDRVRLIVRDSGPGIAEPEKIFDPFYSTKEVGHSEGMGLGLSISYGIVQGFGGALSGRNLPGGGAEFTVDLPAATERAAA